jgi:hypothetical protein
MFFDEHDPPHFHAEHQGSKAVFDFNGNIIRGALNSRTATNSSENGLTCAWMILKKTGRWQKQAKN